MHSGLEEENFQVERNSCFPLGQMEKIYSSIFPELTRN